MSVEIEDLREMVRREHRAHAHTDKFFVGIREVTRVFLQLHVGLVRFEALEKLGGG